MPESSQKQGVRVTWQRRFGVLESFKARTQALCIPFSSAFAQETATTLTDEKNERKKVEEKEGGGTKRKRNGEEP